MKYEHMIVMARLYYSPDGLKKAKVLTVNDKSIAEWSIIGATKGGENF